MRRFQSIRLMWIVCTCGVAIAFTGCGTSRPPQFPPVSADIEEMIRSAPVVSILIHTDTATWMGSAVVRDGGRRLLLTPHQLPEASGACVLTTISGGKTATSYRTVSVVHGDMMASGWTLIEIEDPILRQFADFRTDFVTPLPVGDSLYSVFFVSRSEMGGKISGRFEVRSGRVAAGPPSCAIREGVVLDEFLLIEDEWPGGASGAPVLWYPPGSDSPVIVGVLAGNYRCTDWLGRGLEEVGLVRRPHELVDQPQ